MLDGIDHRLTNCELEPVRQILVQTVLLYGLSHQCVDSMHFFESARNCECECPGARSCHRFLRYHELFSIVNHLRANLTVMSEGDRLQITAAVRINGEAHVPGDKSISHRLAMIGAVAEGTTTIHNFAESAD